MGARLLRERADLVLLALLLGGVGLLPRTDPGIWALGAVTGCVYALYAAGLILVFRAHQVINFAAVAVGAVGAVLTAALVSYDWLTRQVQDVCGCWTTPPSWWRGQPVVRGGQVVALSGPNVGFWLAVGIGLAASVLASYLLYALAVRFLAEAPRLVIALATLFFVSICASVVGAITPEHFASQAQRDAQLPITAPRLPFDWSWRVGVVTLHASDLLVVVAVVVVVTGLGLYLLRSATGVAIRAAADDPTRAATLGVNVPAVTGRVWLIAGLLSGVAGMLLAFGGGLPRDPDRLLDAALLVRVLAVVVFARFTNVAIAAVAAVVLGVVSSSVQFAYSTTAGLDAALLVIIAAALLLQRARRERADTDSGLRVAREIRPVPTELRGLPEVRSWAIRLGLVLAVLGVGAPFVLSTSQTGLASYCLLATMVFLSVLVLTGWAGQLSLGQLAFAGVGAWTVGITDLPFPVALVTAAAAGAVLALLTGIPGLRLRGLHLAVITLALSLAVSSYLLNPRYLGADLRSSIPRPQLFGMDLDNEQLFFYVALALLLLVVAMVVGLRKSAVARALIAARDNEPAAQSFGINLLRVRLGAYAVSGAIAGLAGALIAYQQHAVIPETFSADASLAVFLYATLGGFGAVAAPLLGGAAFTLLQLFASAQASRAALGVGGIIVLLFARGGVAELAYGVRDTLLRGLARRHGIAVPSLSGFEAAGPAARLAIKPHARGRVTVFIPHRYRLEDQYALPAPVDPVEAS